MEILSAGSSWWNTVVRLFCYHPHMLPKFHQRVLYVIAGGDVSLHSYLSGQPTDESQLSMLACFLIYHSVPTPGQLAAGGLEGKAGVWGSTLNLRGHTLLGLVLYSEWSTSCKLGDSGRFLWKLPRWFLLLVNCLECENRRWSLYAGVEEPELANMKKSWLSSAL